MVHSNNFVLAIRDQNRNILREYEGKVYLPFHSEYSLFLKNTNNVRCRCDVKIDGTDVLGGSGLIINPHDCLNLERFLCDGDLNRGRKFKFVPANDAAVADPTSAENGWVSVTFWKEYIQPIYVQPSHVTFTNSGSYTSPIMFASCSSSILRSSDNACYNVGSSLGDVKASCDNVGATVEGSGSSQSFQTVSSFSTEAYGTTLKIQLLGNKQSVTAHDTKKVHCTSCGRKVKFNDNFCGSCGAKI